MYIIHYLKNYKLTQQNIIFDIVIEKTVNVFNCGYIDLERERKENEYVGV